MILQSADGRRLLDLGRGDLVHSAYSTVCLRLEAMLTEVPLGVEFLRTGNCDSNAAQETARQLNLIRDALSQVPPNQAIFDRDDLAKKGPWAGNISPVITSCANLYTTADGQDLLYEIVSILVYASVIGVDVSTIE